MGKWKNYFQSVEDSGKLYNHGNGAYGSFGYRKTGHLKTLYDNSPELKAKYKSYNDLWNTVTKGNYDSPEIQAIDDHYENWLSKRSNGNLVEAAKFNLSDGKNPANNEAYAKKVAKVAGVEDGPAATITTKRTSDSDLTLKHMEIPDVTISADTPLVKKMGNTVPIFKSDWMKPLQEDRTVQDMPREVKKVETNQPKSGVPSNKFSNLVSNAMIYAPNIAGAFRKPPMPPKPILDSPVSLNRMNLNNDRYEVERGTRSADRFAENQLDPQAAFAAKAFNNAQRFNQLSKVNQDERNANTEIGNKEVGLNAQIAQGNNQLIRGYHNDLVQRQLAQQDFQAANLANASDKFVKQQDVQAERDDANKWYNIQMKRDYSGYTKNLMDAEEKKYGGKLGSKYSAGHMKRMNFKKVC